MSFYCAHSDTTTTTGRWAMMIIMVVPELNERLLFNCQSVNGSVQSWFEVLFHFRKLENTPLAHTQRKIASVSTSHLTFSFPIHFKEPTVTSDYLHINVIITFVFLSSGFSRGKNSDSSSLRVMMECRYRIKETSFYSSSEIHQLKVRRQIQNKDHRMD